MFGLALLTMIISARERCWIASPYFVPDEAIISALKFAALRGVDVRIIIPEKKDHWIVYMAAFSFLDEMENAGVKMLRYQRGFMHQKGFLIDEHFAGIGTANLNQRYFVLHPAVISTSEVFCLGLVSGSHDFSIRYYETDEVLRINRRGGRGAIRDVGD